MKVHEKIESEYDKFVLSNGLGKLKEPEVLLIHPDTFREFFNELKKKVSTYRDIDADHIQRPTYRQVNIYRTKDIGVNQIIFK